MATLMHYREKSSKSVITSTTFLRQIVKKTRYIRTHRVSHLDRVIKYLISCVLSRFIVYSLSVRCIRFKVERKFCEFINSEIIYSN